MTPRSTAEAERDARLVYGVISNLALSTGVSAAHIAALAKQSWALRVERGSTFARHGARLPGAFALACGSVKLTLNGARHEQRVLRLVQAGQTFGEATALLARPCSYDATALVESSLIVIPAAPILALVERDARFARTMVMTLAQRELELLAQIESTTLRHGAQRLASYLHSLAEPNGQPGPCTVRLPVTKTLIASRLDMKKETLSRLLRTLANRGLIAVKQREITLLDRARLAQVERQERRPIPGGPDGLLGGVALIDGR